MAVFWRHSDTRVGHAESGDRVERIECPAALAVLLMEGAAASLAEVDGWRLDGLTFIPEFQVRLQAPPLLDRCGQVEDFRFADRLECLDTAL